MWYLCLHQLSLSLLILEAKYESSFEAAQYRVNIIYSFICHMCKVSVIDETAARELLLAETSVFPLRIRHQLAFACGGISCPPCELEDLVCCDGRL